MLSLGLKADLVLQIVNVCSCRPTKVPFDSAYLSNKPNACAVGIGSVESSFLIQNVPGVDSFKHPDYPPLLVFAEYLCALEVSRSSAVI